MRNPKPDLIAFDTASSDLLSLLLNQTDELVFIINRDHTIKYLNKQATQYIKRLNADARVGVPVWDIIPNSLHSTIRAAYEKVLNGETVYIEDAAKKADGSDMYFSTVLRPAINDNGVIEGIVTITKDITEKKISEIQLTESKRNLDLLLNNTDESFIMIDKDCKIVLFNKTAFHSVKEYFDKEIHTGFHFLDIIQAHRKEIIQQVLKKVFDGEELNIELPITNGSEIIAYIINHYRPIADASGKVAYVVIQSKDVTKKKLAEQTLKDAEELWRFALESSHQGVWDWNIDTGKIFYSPSLKKIYGMSEDEEGSYSYWEQHLHPDDKEWVRKSAEKALSAQTDYSETEYRFQVKDEFIWIRDRGFVVKRDESGKPLRIIGTTTDITDQKKSELALKQSEERWRFALEGGNQGVWDWNLQTNEMFLSPSYKKIYGFEDHELQNKYEEWESRVHPDDLGKIKGSIEQHCESNDPYYESVYRMKAKDGSYKWILARGMIVNKTADGKPLRMIGTHTDITETKTAEDTYKLLFFSHPNPMWIYDTNTLEILEVNNSAVMHYGYSRSEFLGKRIKDLRVKEEYEELDGIINELKRSTATRKDVSRHLKKNGEVIYVEVTGNKFDYNGKECRLVTINDITNKVNAENQLKRSEYEYKSLFHNNPLPCWIYDQKTLRFLEVNDAALKHYGYSREEMLRMKILELHPEEQLPELYKRLKKEAERNTIEVLNWKHKRNDGAIIHVDIKSNAITYAGVDARLVVVNDVTYKVAVENELRKSNERFRLAAQATSEALWEWDIENDSLYLSPVYEEIFGYAVKEDRKYNEWQQYIHPDDKERVLNTFYSSIANEEIKQWEEEYRYLKANGEYIYVIDHCIIIRDENGKAIKAVGTYQDITRQKTTEEELRKSNERFAYAAKATSDAVYDWNLTTNHLHWGEGMPYLFGHNPKDVDIENWGSFIHPEDRSRVLDSLTYLVEKTRKKFWKEQYRFLHVDGSYKYVLDKGFVIRDKDGKPLRMIGAMQDITELKLKEKQLIKSNDRFHHAVLATSEIIWDWDLKTNEMIWSDNFVKVMGWGLPENKKIDHSYCFSHVHPEDKDTVEASLIAFKSDPSKTHWHKEYRYQRADGSYAYVSNKAYLIRSNTGEPVRLIGAMQDITEKHYQEHLVTLEREIFELSTNNAFPFHQILDKLLKGVEAIHPDAYTSILKLHDNDTIEQISSPRIPLAFKQAIDGAKIGPAEGSCGAAMFLKKTIIVENIDTHPLWKNFKGLAAQFDLKACWSLPIINSSGKVMGSFAVYHKTIKSPSQKELNTIERVRNIIRVLMENHWSLQEIKTANERFDAVMKATHDLIWDWDLEGGIIYRDPTGLQNVYGVKENEGIENISAWLKHVHPDDQYRVEKVINDILLTKDQDTFDVEYRFKKDDGTYGYVYDRGKIIRDEAGKPLRMIGAAQDITERKRLEQILIQKELERQKAINQATVETQEQERGEIGKELHDNVNQVLTTTKLYLDLALSNAEMRDELIQKSSKNIVNVINEIRQLSRSLMDPSIGDLGLVDSIQDLVGNINLTRKLFVTLNVDDSIDPYLDRNQKLTTFRIIQEALNNAIRHAKATTAIIEIQRKNNWIEMKIKDDGIGFNPDKVKKGAGLKNIQNRVYLIDGTHTIESQPDKGCTININFPIHHN